jgi:hypothetical protein
MPFGLILDLAFGFAGILSWSCVCFAFRISRMTIIKT